MTGEPILVAHRSGNTAASARRDVDLADAIELDVHVHRRKVVLRHEKVLRPTSRLFERWYLLPKDTPVPHIDDVLNAVGDDILLLLDLKCFTRRAARRVRRSVPEDRAVIVACRTWWVLGAFADRPGTTALRSCGSELQLRLASRLPGLGSLLGIVAHQRLLDRSVVSDLLNRTPHVFTWAVTTAERGRELADAGVAGLIVDDLHLDWPRPEASGRWPVG